MIETFEIAPPPVPIHVIRVTRIDMSLFASAAIALGPTVGDVTIDNDGYVDIDCDGEPRSLNSGWRYLIQFSDGRIVRATHDRVGDVLRATNQDFPERRDLNAHD